MKKILFTMLLMAVAIIAVKAEDEKIFNALTTAEEFTAYAEVTDYQARKIMCLIYADALNNPSNYVTFEDYVNAYLARIEGNETWAKMGVFPVHKHALEGSMTNLIALQLEGYQYAIDKKSLNVYHYLSRDTFCNANNISTTDRFNLTVAMIIAKNPTVAQLTEYLTKLSKWKYEIDDDVVLAGYKKLYRKYYPLMQNDYDTYNVIATEIKAVIETYK